MELERETGRPTGLFVAGVIGWSVLVGLLGWIGEQGRGDEVGCGGGGGSGGSKVSGLRWDGMGWDGEVDVWFSSVCLKIGR